MRGLNIKIKRLKNGADLPLPSYSSEGAAGFDLRAAFANNPQILNYGYILNSGCQVAIGTGFAFEIPEGFQLEVRPRSGLSAKYGVTITNSPGTVDSDYRGEILVLLTRHIIDLENHCIDPLIIRHGDRIAQAVLMPVYKANFIEVDSLEETIRGEQGFGSTGIS